MKKSHQYIAIWVLASIVGMMILIWGIHVKNEKTTTPSPSTVEECCGRRRLGNSRHHRFLIDNECSSVVCVVAVSNEKRKPE